jgi:hypothetical protein
MFTWTCHICGKERPDNKISVYTKPLIINEQKVGDQNIRYCNDSEDCYEKALVFEFMRKGSK